MVTWAPLIVAVRHGLSTPSTPEPGPLHSRPLIPSRCAPLRVTRPVSLAPLGFAFRGHQLSDAIKQQLQLERCRGNIVHIRLTPFLTVIV